MFGKSNPVRTVSATNSAVVVPAVINGRAGIRMIRRMTLRDLPGVNSIYMSDLLLGLFRRLQTINLP